MQVLCMSCGVKLIIHHQLLCAVIKLFKRQQNSTLQFMTQVPILKYDRPYVNFLLRNYGFVLPSKKCSSNKYREKFDLCIALYTQVCPKTLTTIKSPLVVRMGPLRICNLENRMIKSVLRYLQILYNVHRYLLDYGNRKNFESTMEKS